MKYRKLRIAWSVACGIVCLLLVALWVRSYWRKDSAYHVSRIVITSDRIHIRLIGYESFRGSIGVQYATGVPFPADLPYYGWDADTTVINKSTPFLNSEVGQTLPSTLGFHWLPMRYGFAVFAPDWFVAALFATLATAPWIRWRFSLRTLLIGMTLVAALLGAVIYAVK